MERKAVSLLGVMLVVSLSGCNLLGKKQAKEDKEQAQEVFNAWVEAHNDHKLSALDTLYADEVFYYSKNFKKRDLIKDKSPALKPGSDFRIEVIDPRWEFREDEATVNYEKYGYWKGKEVHVVSELSMRKFGKSWKITREVDTEVKSVKGKKSSQTGPKLPDISQDYMGNLAVAMEIALIPIQNMARSWDLSGPSDPSELEVDSEGGPVSYKGQRAWEITYVEAGGVWAGEFTVWVDVETGKILGTRSRELR